MTRAFRRGAITGLVLAALVLLPWTGVSWLIDQRDRAEAGEL